MAQPTIARIERGQVDPRFGTLTKLLDACGWELTGSRSGARTPLPPQPGFDPAPILAALTDHAVSFEPSQERSGGPAEVIVEASDENLRRLADVLRILGARATDPSEGVFLADTRSLQARPTHHLETSAGPVVVHLRSGGRPR